MNIPKGLIACGPALLLLAGCGSAPVTPLADTPQYLAARQKSEDARILKSSGESLGRAQAEDVERHLAENPDDLVARRKLLYFYASGGTRFYNPEAVVTARRKHILWLIEHHPDDPLLGSREGMLKPPPLEHIDDPSGYEQAKKMWLALVAKPDVPIPVLYNAAEFLSDGDKPLAEKLLLQGEARDPDDRLPMRLGKLYGDAVAGSDTFAEHARQQLDATKDVSVLAGAGGVYVDRALQLSPQSIRAHQAHARLHRPPDGSAAALALQALNAYNQGDLDTARKTAEQSLKSAESAKKDPDSGTAIFQAHMILGLVAMHDEDRKSAVKHMTAAGAAPATEELTYVDQPLAYVLPGWLLKTGERESVIAFLQQFAQTSVLDRQELTEAAATIQHGQKPLWYPAETP